MWQDCAILLTYSALRLQVTKVSALFDNVISDVRILRDSSDQWQAYHHAGRSLIPGQPLWNLWWKKWHQDFFLGYLGFCCYYHCTNTPYSAIYLSQTLCNLKNSQRR